MASVKLKDMREGSVVMVAGGFGTEPAVKAIVQNTESDIKNGRPGIDYEEVSSKEGRWCYLDQVKSVVKY